MDKHKGATSNVAPLCLFKLITLIFFVKAILNNVVVIIFNRIKVIDFLSN